MRIEYRILWVEDNKSWYETTVELFREKLEEQGFELVVKYCKDFRAVEQEILRNQLKEYNLLLVDYSLGSTATGGDVIKFIRDQNNPILTEALFYSTAVEDVRKSMHSKGLEGVYTADRKEIETKFEQVFNTTIKKIQEVNTMRGLIMAETSDLDDFMLTIIEKLLVSDIAEDIKTYINEKIQETLDSNIKLVENPNIFAKIKDGRIFYASHKAKVINKLYSLTEIGISKFFNSYNKDVIAIRNIFAHVKEVTQPDGTKILSSHMGGKTEEFTEARCIEIRKNLIKYRDLLEKIKKDVDTL